MKTLFCLRSAPHPPIGGAPLRNWQNINAMAKLGPVAVFTAFPGQPLQTEQPFGPWEHFEITDVVWGEPRTVKEYLYRMRPWGQEACDRYYRPAAAAQLRSLLESFRPDVTVLGEPWMYGYLPVIRAYCRQAAREERPCQLIFDNHNVEAEVSLYQDRLPRRPGLRGKLEARIRHGQILRMERTLCRQAEIIWVCSELDRAMLCQLYALSPEKVSVVPNGVDLDRFEPVRQRQLPRPELLVDQAPTILFAATFDYSANIEAAHWLMDEIYPLLQRNVPELKLMLVGRGPTEKMQAAAQANPHLIIPGLVKDILPYYAAATAIVVPLRHGSGTRLKLLEAFAAERPVVSTAKGAEGLTVEEGQHLWLAETPEAIAQRLLQIIARPEEAQPLAKAAFELVSQRYAWNASAQKIYDSLGLA